MSKTCPGENRAHLRCSLGCLLDNSWCHYLVTYTHEHHGHSSCYIIFFPSSEPTKSLSYQSGSSFFIFFYVHKPFCLPTHHLSPTEGFHPEDLLVPNNILLILQALIKKYCFLFFSVAALPGLIRWQDWPFWPVCWLWARRWPPISSSARRMTSNLWRIRTTNLSHRCHESTLVRMLCWELAGCSKKSFI